MMQGIVALGYGGDPEGWGDRISTGKGRDIYGAGLPKRIYVRWQSLVEPQTYRAIIEIPEQARRIMLTDIPPDRPGGFNGTRRYLSIGLAPGGWIKAWLLGPGSPPVEVLCTRAQVEPKGPSQGRMNGRYAYSFDQLEPETQVYLKTHAIPYDSWKCPNPPPTTVSQTHSTHTERSSNRTTVKYSQ